MQNDKPETFVREIAWEKWRDPYGSDYQEAEWPGAIGTLGSDDKVRALLGKEENGEELDYDDDDYPDADDIDSPSPPSRKVNFPVLITNMGMIPVTEHTRAGAIFNFWTAHTNFRLTQEIIDIINNTDGVETFNYFTPYRWRISIGKAFNTALVKDRVTKNLDARPLQIE